MSPDRTKHPNTQTPGTPPHARATTMRDIAVQCGVSIWTVSLALRHDPRVSAATAERVLAAANTLGYDPAIHQAARRLVSKRLGQPVLNNVIGLLLPPHFQTANYFAFTSLGVLDVLATAGYAVLTTYAHLPTQPTTPNFPPIYTRGEVDGVISMGYFLGDPLIQRLRANPGFANRPMVSLILPRDGCSSVMTDDRAGAYAATTHLLELGHRHILHSYDPAQVPLMTERLAGAQQAMRDAGFDPERNLHYTDKLFFGNLNPPHHLRLPDLTSDDQLDVVARHHLESLVAYLKAHPEVTAILAYNDPTARRIWYMLQQRGLRVPEDISLIGFDDTDAIPDEYGRNVLTTVRLPLELVGQEGARLIIRRLTGEAEEQTHLVLPTELVIRSSTAPPCVRG